MGIEVCLCTRAIELYCYVLQSSASQREAVRCTSQAYVCVYV